MNLQKLVEMSELAKQFGGQSNRRRDLFPRLLAHRDRTFPALLGPRGVGKTILLKQLHAASADSIYISVDTLDREVDLFEIIRQLSSEFRFKRFFLDEVHFLPTINQHLKMIFDTLSVEVTFTSSIALKLVESAYDLSRRVKLVSVPPFSYREFLSFNGYHVPAPLSWPELMRAEFGSEHIAGGARFREYLRGKNYPLSLDVTDVLGTLRSVLQKIISSDIPVLQNVQVSELALIEKTFQFIARSPVSDIGPSSVSRNVGITNYKAQQYLKLLEQAFVVHQVYPNGTNVLREPKVLLTLPFRLLELDEARAIGGLREDFAVECLSRTGMAFTYLKSQRGAKTPDYLVSHGAETFVVEIGGAGKTSQQFKNSPKDFQKIIFADELSASESDGDNQVIRRLPLFMLGYLESHIQNEGHL
jgi:predicted AAA+ superfamily ATPase